MQDFPFSIDQNCYAVVGDPVVQSLSPQIHHQFAQNTSQDIHYHKWHLTAAQFVDAVTAFFEQGGGGLNVTVPHKLRAFDFADRLSERAHAAKAVNTLWCDDGQIVGDNTDGIGLMQDIKRLNWKLRDRKIVVLGAGGAVRGVLQPLLMEAPASVIIANRTIEKATVLVEEFYDLAKKQNIALRSCSLDDVRDAADLVINGTSTGLSETSLAISPSVVTGARCYDMVYGSQPTTFMQWASENGAQDVADGLGMLIGQAAESFEVWRGVKPETTSVIENIRAKISTKA